MEPAKRVKKNKTKFHSCLFKLLVMGVLLYFQVLLFTRTNDSTSDSYKTFLKKRNIHIPSKKIQIPMNDGSESLIFDIYPNFINPSLKSSEIILVTHGTISKLSLLLENAKRWKGPISFALFINNAASPNVFNDNMDILFNFLKKNKKYMKSVAIHIVTHTHDNDSLLDDYPTNLMRNIALENSVLDFVLLLDVDFIVSSNAKEELESRLKTKILHLGKETTLTEQMMRRRIMLVLPTFRKNYDPKKSSKALKLPETKNELIKAIRRKEISSFTDNRANHLHGPTDTNKWMDIDKLYEATYETGYEPYVLAHRTGLPSFWNGFIGYAYNKQSWYEECNRCGYKFLVLPETFLIHIDHPHESRTYLNKSVRNQKYFISNIRFCKEIMLFKLYLKKHYTYDDETSIPVLPYFHCKKVDEKQIFDEAKQLMKNLKFWNRKVTT